MLYDVWMVSEDKIEMLTSDLSWEVASRALPLVSAHSLEFCSPLIAPSSLRQQIQFLSLRRETLALV